MSSHIGYGEHPLADMAKKIVQHFKNTPPAPDENELQSSIRRIIKVCEENKHEIQSNTSKEDIRATLHTSVAHRRKDVDPDSYDDW